VNVTDVFFDAPLVADPEGPGNDTLDGGVGDDVIYGETGDDSIVGGSGNDTLYGDDAPDLTPIGPNLIVNGSFEDTSGMTPTGYGFVGNGEIPGWTDAGGEEIDVHNDGRGGVNPTDGDNWLDLEASPGNNRVGQDVQGVQAGASYLLTFDAGDATFAPQSGSGENLINVYWGGDLIATIDPNDGTMDSYEFVVEGGAGDGSDRLEFEGTGTEDNIGASVDNVSLVQVADPTGLAGNDTIEGGTGADVIFGQDGSDDLSGGDGDDTITGGAGDEIVGGSGSDSIVIDAAELDETGENDGPIFVDGSTEGSDQDTLDLTGFVAFRNLVETPDPDGDSTSGTLEVQNADGDWVPVTFAEIETLLLPPKAPDGVVDGEETGEEMLLGYDDSNAPTDGGGDQITNDGDVIEGNGGDDTIDAAGGDDTVDGGTGDDVIAGGSGDDQLDGADGNDDINGGTGDDSLVGGDGDDTLEGGRGSDTLLGDGDNDLIIGGAGDSIVGGGGADTIVIDPAEVDGAGENATGIFVDGSTNGDDRDTLDLTAFEAHRNLVETVDTDGDSTSGSVEVLNTEGEWVPVTFAEIETLLLPPKAPDGVVDGEEFGEVMGLGYDDANAPTDGGGDLITNGDDVIEGNGGDDSIDAAGGNDTVDGGADNDTVNGNAGNDLLDGGDGDDLVTGGVGDDTVLGGAGDDELRGNDGDDSLDGGDGNDSMGGAEGADTLQGGAGIDTLSGGSGDDVLDGGLGDDVLNGNSGNDEITDLDGDNLVTSGPDGLPDRGFPFVGNADADPFDDRDTITTGDGNDTIISGDDNDVIDAGNGDNVIDAGFDDDSITSGDGADEITSGEGSDTINSGGGDDTIFGGLGPVLGSSANLIDDNVNPANNDPILDNGDDLIDAGDGDDLVFGEDDNDTILGGAGNDTLDGGIDDDVIEGGAGDDEIIGGQGADSLSGGLGNDTFDVGLFTDPIFGDTYVEGAGDTIVGGEDPGDGDVDVLDLSGAGPLKIVFDDAVDPTGTPGESGTVTFFTDNTQTTVAGTLTFSEIENVIPCFTPGSLIATPKGEVPVESLREGDKVITRDNGIQEIRWVGNRTLNRDELARAPNLRPVLIKAGSLGHGLPERDMLVSPQHRVLIAGDRTQLFFDESEVLVAAKHLVNAGSIQTVDTLRTTYIHFMFDRHEVVLSDGAWTESFQPGDQTLGAMGDETRNEIVALFPELATQEGITDYTAARRALKAHEAKLLQL